MEIKTIIWSLAIASVMLAACNTHKVSSVNTAVQPKAVAEQPAVPMGAPPKPEVCRYMEQLGLVEIQTLSPDIKVILPYGTTDNFTGIQLYETSQYAYFQKDVAAMIVKAEAYLHEQYPTHMLLVYDGARPCSVQQKMWNAVKGTKGRYYVAPPARKGLHNYGAAVDITIIDTYGNPLDMGCPFDTFDKTAHIDNEAQLVKEGLLTQAQYENRLLLRNIMRKAGFSTISREWWHFNACSLKQAQEKYTLIQ